MGPLSFLRRLIPASASRDETALYDRLYKEVGARRDALEGKIQKATMRAGSDSDAQRALVASPKYQELERQLNPLFIARGNLLSAKFAAPNDDLTARLLLGINDEETRHLASLLHRGTRYHAGDKFLPENGVYIEGLSSEIPGAGTQLLKDLESQFPGAPMYLESVSTPATKEFYLKKGFMPQPEGSTPAIPSNLWIKPGDVKVRAKGGVVRMEQGGPTPKLGRDTYRDKSVMDNYVAPASQQYQPEPGLGAVDVLDALPWGPGKIGKALGALSALTKSEDASAATPGQIMKYLLSNIKNVEAPYVIHGASKPFRGIASKPLIKNLDTGLLSETVGIHAAENPRVSNFFTRAPNFAEGTLADVPVVGSSSQIYRPRKALDLTADEGMEFADLIHGDLGFDSGLISDALRVISGIPLSVDLSSRPALAAATTKAREAARKLGIDSVRYANTGQEVPRTMLENSHVLFPWVKRGMKQGGLASLRGEI